MALAASPTPPEQSLAFGLDEARLQQWEQPGWALSAAVRSQQRAHTLGAAALEARAILLQAAVSMHCGDLRGAYELAASAEPLAGTDPVARTELAALYAHLHYFSGSYAEALRHAEEAVALSDSAGDLSLRIHARRMGCVAIGNLGVESMAERLHETLGLAVEADSPWEVAICRNDLACLAMEMDDFDESRDQLEQALTIARGLAPHNRLILGVLHSTRADLHMRTEAPRDAVRDATRSIAHLTSSDDVNPYLLGMTVLVLVRGQIALGAVEDARRAGEGALSQLGNRVPQARSMILSAMAEALREAGRAEEAYVVLARSTALAHEALEQFSLLQVGLDRARLHTASARRQADMLAEKNRRLELVVDHLRDQASRDPLTGLHNRRELTRAYWLLTDPERIVSLAVTDIDHFKSVNDRFGHHVGDQVLVRFAELLVAHVRGEDVVVRIGGEEFALLMPGADAREAGLCCERLRKVVAAERWDRLVPELTLTASFGVATGMGRADPEGLQREADDRLYEAKRAGRNRVA